MIGYFRSKIAHYVVNKKLGNKLVPHRSFKNLLSNCSGFFVVMPEIETDFQKSIQVLNFLEEHKKRVTVLNFDFRRHEVNQMRLSSIIEYGLVDYSKLHLPSHRLTTELEKQKFDAVIDLNRGENLFCSFVANIVQSDLIIGFSKVDSDKYYNIQINDNEDNSEISYKNFINCLQMF